MDSPPSSAAPGERPTGPGSSSGELSFAETGILSRLRELNRPVTVGELARILGAHRNTVARHLDALVATGHVSVESAPRTGRRGRPAQRFTALAPAPPRDRVQRELSSLLAGEIARSGEPAEAARRLGRRWGMDVLARHPLPGDRVKAVVEYLAEAGFAPELSEDGTTVQLSRCPMEDAATAHPDVVCVLHNAMLATLMGSADGLPELPDHEVCPGSCRVRLSAAETPADPPAGPSSTTG